MFIKEKALLRKIKKTEKKKLKRIQDKQNETIDDVNSVQENVELPSSDNEDTAEGETKTQTKRKNDENIETKQKKNKKSSEIETGVSSEDNTSDEITTTNQPQLIKSTLVDETFDSLKDKISEKTMKAIKDMGFTHMTEIQAKTLPLLLEGKNVVGTAKTGSGKTLAFLIHAIEFVYKLKYKHYTGTGVIILSPTRELAMQTYGVLNELMKYHTHSFGLIMGGANRKTEADKLFNGVNILVATPGRLLDHMKNPNFKYDKAACLIIDEADRILDVGFEKELYEILKQLRPKRQNILFSATQSDKTQTLKSMLYQKEPIYITLTGPTQEATVIGLKQGYVVCPPERRLRFLFKFLSNHKSKKVMVFFNSCLSAKFHSDLLNCIDLDNKCIHGKQKQNIRTRTFFQFCNADAGILFCTDVAARGWDIPAVDWIVQYDPPTDPKEYIHRVGRTARGEGGTGQSLLVLRQEELGFIDRLHAENVDVPKFPILWEKFPDIQNELDHLVTTNLYLLHSARNAFDGYIKSYNSLQWKDIFDIDTLDLSKACRSFGLLKPITKGYNK